MTSCSWGLKGAASPLVLSSSGSDHACPGAIGQGRAGPGRAGRAGRARRPRPASPPGAARAAKGLTRGAGGGGAAAPARCRPPLSPRRRGAPASAARERAARPAGPARQGRERDASAASRAPRAAGAAARPGLGGPGRRPARGVLRRHAPAPPPSSSGGRCRAGGLLPAAPGPREPGGGLGRAEPARLASPDREGNHAPGSGRLQPVVWVLLGSSLFPSFPLPLRSPFCSSVCPPSPAPAAEDRGRVSACRLPPRRGPGEHGRQAEHSGPLARPLPGGLHRRQRRAPAGRGAPLRALPGGRRGHGAPQPLGQLRGGHGHGPQHGQRGALWPLHPRLPRDRRRREGARQRRVDVRLHLCPRQWLPGDGWRSP